MSRRGVALLAAAVLATAGPAIAGGADVGEAGLRALQKGAYQQAVKLFTEALGAKDLSPDDREFAFVCRAKAYLGEGDRQHALTDLREAVQLKPDDGEAQSLLEHALGTAAGHSSEEDAASGDWGLFSSLAGHAYWYEIAGSDPHAAYMTFLWATPGQVLSVVLHNHKGVAAAIEFVRDPGSQRLLIASQYSIGPVYGIAVTRRQDYAVERTLFNGKPLTDTLRLQPDGTVQGTESVFKDGGWTAAGSYSLVQTNEAELIQLGFLKKRR